MASITVDSTTMRTKANTFQTVARTIQTLTGEMTQTINGLSSTWKGTAQEALVTTFNKLSSNFDEKYETINSYAAFLNEAADAYDKAQSDIAQAAEGKN